MPKLSNRKIIKRIQKERAINNLEWEKIFGLSGTIVAKKLHRKRVKTNKQLMRILLKALENNNIRTRKILKTIIRNDHKIDSWMGRLHG